MREFKNHILGKKTKDELKLLMDRSKALETQNTQKDDKIKRECFVMSHVTRMNLKRKKQRCHEGV